MRAEGQTVTDALNRLPAIESALGTRRGAARIEPDPVRADRAYLRVLDRDPHAEPILWPGPTATTITEPVELGLFEDASPVEISLLRRHVLLGGTTGSGKSGVLNVVLAAPPSPAAPMSCCGASTSKQAWNSGRGRHASSGWPPRPPKRPCCSPTPCLCCRIARVGLAAKGLHEWDPSPTRPALVIVVDEYAELADAARDALRHADSIARRGRAPGVTLIIATQRPTQKTMGAGSVRSQLEVRICLRVQERRDVELILDKGMLSAGWNAHTLDAPGKFYLYSPGSDVPRRARGYRLDGDDLTATIARNANRRPTLALPLPPAAELVEPAHDPEVTLWAALASAGAEGLSIPTLMDTTGMGRTWVYGRLRKYADAGRALQVARGRWTAVEPS